MTMPPRLRSLLFAPAVRPDLIAKMPATGADLVAIDLEDATPVIAKADARNDLDGLVGSVIDQVAVSVRVNDPTTEWFVDDIHALPSGLATIIVPKVETTDGLDHVYETLVAADLAHHRIIAGLETALGVADSRLLLSHPVVAAGYFGAEDFIADMGGIRTPGNHEVAFARSQVALAGRLAEVVVLDQVVADFRDDERSRLEAEQARAMGYAGKLCIHPAQVKIATDVFTPSVDEVAQATRLVAAYEEASANGVAAIDFDGQMVDEPVAAQARRLISLADDG